MSGLKDQVSSQGQAPRLSGVAEASVRPPFAPPTPQKLHLEQGIDCQLISTISLFIIFTTIKYSFTSFLRKKLALFQHF